MHHHHHHESAHSHKNESKVDHDENVVTRWLNTMEASLASPDHKFDPSKFSNEDRKIIDAYAATHEKSLARYEKLFPKAHVSEDNEALIFC